MDGQLSICNALLPKVDGSVSYRAMRGFSVSSIVVLHNISQTHPKEFDMSQNTKDSKGGKTHPVKETPESGGKKPGKGSADHKQDSPAGSQSKGEKKTTP